MDFVFKSLIGFDVLWLCICFVTEPNTAVTLEPMFDSEMANVTVKEMSLAVLPCSVKYLGRRQVIWTDKFSTVLTYEDRRVIDDIRLSLERPFVKDWNLHIRDVQYKDRGMYNCQINTTPVKIKVVYLTVQVPAKILNTSSPTSVTVREGQTVTLWCNVSGIPAPLVIWNRLGQGEKGEGYKKKLSDPGEGLIIHNISRHCADIYQCTASNGVPPAVSRNISVNVHFPPEVKLPTERLGQIIGKETILECQVTASPLNGYEWKKDGVVIKAISGSVKYRLEKFDIPGNKMGVTISLKISFLDKSDYGTYLCEAFNHLGRDHGTMELYEYTPPEPTSTTTTTTTTTIPTLPGVPPYKTHHQHRQRPDRFRQQQQKQHHRGRHNHNNHNNPRYHQQGTGGSVVVKDDRLRNQNYKPEDGRYQSGYNDGKTGESLRGHDGGGTSTTPSWIISLFVALVTVLCKTI